MSDWSYYCKAIKTASKFNFNLERELEAAVDEMNPLLLKRDDLIKNINCTKQRIKTEEEEVRYC